MKLEFLEGNRYSLIREGLPSVDLYLYKPDNPVACEDEALPVYINAHGGGWRGGDATLTESFCKTVADGLGAWVINVNYEKRPPKPFPYAAEEICSAVEYCISHAEELRVNPNQIIIGGESAGAQLSASAAILLSDRGVRLCGQCLIYPCLDMVRIIEHSYAWVKDVMFPCGGEDSRVASPILHPATEFSAVAPAVILTCGRDFLREDGIRYAKLLTEAGDTVIYREYPDALHGFIEVNRPEYPKGDPRRSPEQEEMCHNAESFLIRAMQLLIGR